MKVVGILFWVMIALLGLISLFHMEAHFTPEQIRTGFPILAEMLATPWGGFALVLLVIAFVVMPGFRRMFRSKK
ncbi:MAG: hypothetical protein ACREGH_02425 [Minisyncoccia bacterium]